MKNFIFGLSLLSGLLLLSPAISEASNITSLELDGEFSACNILKAKYEILKLRLEITEKFGYYVPEIDQKLKALQYRVEKLYKSLEYQEVFSDSQVYTDSSLEKEKETSNPIHSPLVEVTTTVPGEAVTEGKVQKTIAAAKGALYITKFDAEEEPKVCQSSANGDSICSNLALPTSCAEPNGLTCSNNKCRIQVKDSPSFMVACNEDWIVIQRRINGSVDFNRDWSAYKNGFGDLDGEFWMGLDKLHALTTALAPVELMIKMKDYDDTERYASYESFAVGSERENYALQKPGEYTGDAGDSFSIHRDEGFTTFDKDNDKNAAVNCAQSLFGGWWFYDCGEGRENSNLNGQYYEGQSDTLTLRRNGIKWTTFRGNDHSLKFVQMMIRKR